MTRRTTSGGFTLIELSIVLVIIGLIVGGVLVGQDLIRSAELRSVISDIEKFNTAVNTFRAKYDCLPGDCPNATQFFGTDAQCANRNPLTTGTCNGDGNGIITEQPPSNGNNFYHMENVMFWQQLSLAGLIPGSYNGLQPATGTAGSTPTSRISNACYTMEFSGPGNTEGIEAGGYMFTDVAAHMFLFGSTAAGAWICGMNGGPLSALDAMNIDQKIDDGMPASGQVMTFVYVQTPSANIWNPCVTSFPPPYTYNTNNAGPACGLSFQAQF